MNNNNRALFVSLVAILLLSMGLIGCGGEEVPEYNLTISSTEGGEVGSPGEGTFSYDEGTVVPLVAFPHTGYWFVSWSGDVDGIADVEDASTTIIMDAAKSVTANFAPLRCDLTVDSTEGGSVTTTGEGTSTYDYGTVVDLVATPDEGYQFVDWTGDVSTIPDVNAASTTITMNGDYIITASFAKEIRDWNDLDTIRDNLGGSYVLMNDLDSTTAGYVELASLTANQGRGWEPIGSLSIDPLSWYLVYPLNPFIGSLDGQGYEIRDLFIDRPDQDLVGLFCCLDHGGLLENLGVVDSDLTGRSQIGGLVGENRGVVRNTYYTGSVAGFWRVAGLVGSNDGAGIVSNSYFEGSVIGAMWIDGLVAGNLGTVSNSHYNYDEVLINGKSTITTGALFAEDFEEWLANNKSLDVNERLSKEGGYYVINDVGDFKELLAFGQDGALKFRLTNDLDLGDEPNFYVPYLAGQFDGNGHKVWNLSFHSDFAAQVGLFGYIASGGKISEVSAENVNIAGTWAWAVGGLVGHASWGSAVSNSYSTGSVIGLSCVGGLVGDNSGTVDSCYSTGSVTGSSDVGGLAGLNGGTVTNSHYNYDEVLINGKSIITVGALFTEDFEQWLADDKSLSVSGRLAQEDDYYVIDDIGDFKELLAFGQDDSLKFRLTNDLDLGDEPNFYIPYLAGEFDGNGHKIWNLSFNFGFVSSVGLFGYLGSGAKVSRLSVENVNIIGDRQVGGLVGGSAGTVTNSHAGGSVSGRLHVGGLMGVNDGGTVNDTYSAGSVGGGSSVGGLVGWNVWGSISSCYSICNVKGESSIGGLVGEDYGSVSNSHSTGSVTGQSAVGGLVGNSHEGTVSNCYSTGGVAGQWEVGGLVGYGTGTVNHSFWDTQTSGQATSEGGTGKTTAEMKSINTFSGAGWNMIAVANPDSRNPSYIWNIVDGQTYPFLSWES